MGPKEPDLSSAFIFPKNMSAGNVKLDFTLKFKTYNVWADVLHEYCEIYQ
jgi:hypothetical protein